MTDTRSMFETRSFGHPNPPPTYKLPRFIPIAASLTIDKMAATMTKFDEYTRIGKLPNGDVLYVCDKIAR